MKKVFVYSLFALCLMVCGCSHQSKDATVLHREFFNTLWERFDYVYNDIEVKEPTSFDLNMNISFTDDYPENYFEMVFTVFDPRGERYRSKGYKFTLKDTDGQWKSQLNDGCYTFELPINKDLKITDAGTYRFQVEYRMPKTPLAGVKELTIYNNR